MPATTRVVQIEPGPTPTLTPSAPESISALAPSRVATLPPTTSTEELDLILATISPTSLEWPCAVSTTMKSAPASISAWARSKASPATPTAAPTMRRPSASLAACGYFSALTKSLTVIRPLSTPSPSTSGSFSILWRRSSSMASAREMPTLPVTSGIGVMTSRTSRLRSVSKAMSRLVTMPSSLPEASVTGTPLMRKRPHSSSASRSVASGRMVIGSVTMPDSDRLTWSTWSAWSSIERLRCSTPTPPCRAMAIAMRASVTLSIAAEISGTFTFTLRETYEEVSMSCGAMSDSPGSSSTSS